MARTLITLGHPCFVTDEREGTGGSWVVPAGGLLCLMAAPFLGILWAWRDSIGRW